MTPMDACRFCQSDDVTLLPHEFAHAKFYTVACNSCEAQGPTGDTETDAIEAWNRAAQPAQSEAKYEDATCDAVRELLAHISDVMPDEAFDLIDTAKWNAVTAIIGEKPAVRGHLAFARLHVLREARDRLTDPDTTFTAQWAGQSVKYHSRDQIVEYTNGRIRKWRDYGDKMHQRAMNAERQLAELQATGKPGLSDLLDYVLQDDIHNRLTPRVIDIAYTAFMLAKGQNKEDGGPTDWFTDTRPVVNAAIAKLRKDLLGEQDNAN